MKHILLTATLFFTTSLLADVFIDKDVYDLLKKMNLDSATTELVLDSIYDASYEFGAGDDGKDCPSEVLSLNLISASSKQLKFSYQAQQDYVGTYGCMDIPSTCHLTVTLTGARPMAVTTCSYNF